MIARNWVRFVIALLVLGPPSQAQNRNPEQLFNAAMAAQQRGDLNAAVDGYEHVLKISPALVPARVNLAAALLQLGRSDEAVTNYQAAVKLAPGNVRIATLLGNALISLHRYDEAVELLQPLEPSHPRDLDLAFMLGEALIDSGRPAKGLRRIERVAEERRDPNAWLLAGLTQLRLGQYAKARANLEEALRLNPALPGAYTLSGMAKMGLGDEEGAKSAYRKALELDPNDFDANLRLGFILIRQQNLNGADQCLRRALQANPTSVAARYEMAQLRIAQGREPDAAAELEGIARDVPNLLKPHVQLAAVYYRLHRRQDGQHERQIVETLLAHPQNQAADPEAELMKPSVIEGAPSP